MIPANTLRYSIRGNLVGNEIWNCSVFLRPTGMATAPTNAADTAALLTTFVGLSGWSTFRSAILGTLRATSGITEERLYSYPTDSTAAAAVAVNPDIAAGTGAAGPQANQVAAVMTLLTGVAGRSNRGRIYIPATGVALGTTDSQFGASGMSTLRTGFAAWTLSLAGLAAGWAPYVVSQTHTSSRPVVQVRTDTRPDIQRRRANRQAATTVAVTNTPWI